MNSPEQKLRLNLADKSGSRQADVTFHRLIVAGWTGRDVAAMEAHIRELEEVGIPRPARTPIFYRNSVLHLTTADVIEVTGDNTSGEAEFIIAHIDGEKWVGIGSDHTDRELEKQGITIAKQICDKPMGSDFWRYADVAGHWDELQLRATITEDGKEVVYQEGPVSKMRAPEELLAMFGKEDADGGLRDGDALMCGTLAAIGGIRPASRFSCELIDPVLNRSISHAYDIVELPVEG